MPVSGREAAEVDLLHRPYPQKLQLIKDLPFIVERFRPRETRVWILRPGEIGEYFEYNDCYCFMARDGYVPYFSRAILIELTEFIREI